MELRNDFDRDKLLLYEFLLNVFIVSPNEEFTKIVKEMFDNDFVKYLKIDSIKQKYYGIRDKISQYSDVDLLNFMKKDFYELFVSPVSLKAPLWQSFYENEEGLLYQDAHKECKKLYHKYGYDIEKKSHPYDHLSIQLQFLIKLSEIRNDNDDAKKDYDDFIQNILSWILKLKKSIEQYNEDSLYVDFVDLLEIILNIDLQRGV